MSIELAIRHNSRLLGSISEMLHKSPLWSMEYVDENSLYAVALNGTEEVDIVSMNGGPLWMNHRRGEDLLFSGEVDATDLVHEVLDL